MQYAWASPCRSAAACTRRTAAHALIARLDRARLLAGRVVEVRFDCRRRATESCSDLGDREPLAFAEVARQRHRLPALEHPVVPSQLSDRRSCLPGTANSGVVPRNRPHASRTPATRRVRMSVPRAPSGPKEIAQRRLPRVRGRSVAGAKRAALLRLSQLGSGPLPIGTRRTSGEPVPRRFFWLPLRVATRAITNRIRRVRAASESDRAPLARLEVALRLIGLAHAC